MKTRNKLIGILTSGFLACCCAICALQIKAGASKTAMAETAAPSITIESKNVAYDDYLHILYAVSNEGFDRSQNQIQMLFWNEPQTEYSLGTEDYAVSNSGNATVKGKDCLIFYSNGIAAKEMTDSIYVRAYATVDGEVCYSETMEYSVEQYVEDVLANPDATDAQKTLVTAMLNYGEAAEAVLNNGGAAAANTVSEAEATVPTLTVEAKNVSYAESMYILCAVSNDLFDRTQNKIQMLFWNEPQTEYVVETADYAVSNSGNATVMGKDCLVFYSNGIAAKEMTENIYARAYAEVDGVAYYSEIVKYSVLEYVYQMREKGGLTDEQETLYEAMLNYGAAAQVVLNHNTGRLANATYHKVSVENGTLTDVTTMGRYVAGEQVSLRAGAAPGEEYRFLGWYEGDTLVSNEAEYTFTVEKAATYRATWTNSATYTIKYHFETVDGKWTDSTTVTREGTIGTEVVLDPVAELQEYFPERAEYFTYYEASDNNITTGTILADGSLELKLGYKRKTYEIKTARGSDETKTYGTVAGSGTYKYGAEVTLTATTPTEVTDAGYTFGGWYDGTTLVSESAEFTFTVKAAKTYTARWYGAEADYTVRHYLQKLDDETGYDNDSQTLSGRSGTPVVAEPRSYEHFTYDGGAHSSTDISATIKADGKTVLKLFYTRNSYTISALSDNETYGTVSGAGTYKYETSLTLTATPKAGYAFAGWYDGETLVCETAEFTFTVDKNITYTAKWSASNATYTVNHYWENIDDDNYTLHESYEYEGVSGNTVTVNALAYEHFTYNEGASTVSGTIAGDNSLVLNVYYTRDTYTIKTAAASDDTNTYGTVTAGGTYKYGAEVTLTATTPTEVTDAGYTFSGWYNKYTLLCETAEFTVTVENDATYHARWFGAEVSYTVRYRLQNVDGEYEKVDYETQKFKLPSGTPAPAPEIREYEHFTFDYYDANRNTLRTDGKNYMYVYYTRNSYTVTAVSNNEAYGTVTGGGTYRYEKQITLTATSNAGYAFAGWYDGETLVSESAEFTFTVDKNVTYTAKWSEIPAAYTVNYYLQNVDNDNYTLTNTLSLTGSVGSTATAEVDEPEGTTVNASKSTLSGTIASDGGLVLEVYYDRNVYTVETVSENTTYGTVTAGGTYKYGKEITLTATPKAGYTFLGWYEGETLVSSDEAYTLTVSKTATYTAKWSAAPAAYTVKYYLQNLDDNDYTLQETATLTGTTEATVNATIKEYAHFTYNAGESTVSGVVAGDGSLVLEVYYDRNVYTVEALSDNEAHGTVTAGGTYKYETQITLTATTKAGYTFKGWYDGETLKSTEEVCTVTVEGAATYTAKWTANTNTKYLVRYYVQSLDDPDTYQKREEVEKTGTTGTTATAEIKEFTHFTHDGGAYSSSVLSATIKGDGSTVLKVFYTRDSYTVEAVSDNETYGTVTAGGTYKYGKEITLTATPKAGYTFLGWYEGETLVSSNAEFTFNVEKNATYTAKWSAGASTYTVKHYQQNIADDEYALYESYEFEGQIGATATANPLAYEHFTYNEGASTVSGVIAEDGSLVLSVYYTRDTYQITAAKNADALTVSGGGTYKYGAEVTLKATTKVGYTWLGWYEDETLASESEQFTFNAEKNVTYTAKWEANEVNYKVVYYLAQLGNSAAYINQESLTLTAKAGEQITAEIKDFAHFTYDEAKSASKISATIRGDGKTQLTVYYTRDSYTVSAASENATYGTVTGGGTYEYETQLTLTATPKAGYEFAGWYEGNTLASSDAEFTFTVDKNVTYTARFEEAQQEVSLLEFEAINSGAAYKVVGIGEHESGIVTIPANYNGKPVTTIGASAFNGVRDIGELVISDSVTTIEDYAFASCLDLTKVTMGNDVTSIGKYAFAYCNQMVEITFSNKLKTIDENAFYGCLRIKSLAFSNTLTTIAKEAFKDCKKVQTITFGTGLTTIGEAAFYRCEALEELTIPDGAATTIGNRAFMNCTSIRKITFGNSVKTIGAEAFGINKTDDGSTMLLKELVIGDGVTSIGEYAFAGARKLNKVTLGSSVKTISTGAFDRCETLREIYNKSSLSISAESTSYGGIAANAFYVYKSGSSRITVENGLYIYTYGSSVRLIGVAFDENTDLILPDKVTEISPSACYNEEYITAVIIGSTSKCTKIGASAFQNSYNIRKLDLTGSKLTILSTGAFANNVEICQVIIGKQLTTVGGSAFLKKGMDGVKKYKVYYTGTQTQWNTLTSSFGTKNDDITGSDATVAYYSASKPSSTSVLYWYYDSNNQPTYW